MKRLFRPKASAAVRFARMEILPGEFIRERHAEERRKRNRPKRAFLLIIGGLCSGYISHEFNPEPFWIGLTRVTACLISCFAYHAFMSAE